MIEDFGTNRALSERVESVAFERLDDFAALRAGRPARIARDLLMAQRFLFAVRFPATLRTFDGLLRVLVVTARRVSLDFEIAFFHSVARATSSPPAPVVGKTIDSVEGSVDEVRLTSNQQSFELIPGAEDRASLLPP